MSCNICSKIWTAWFVRNIKGIVVEDKNTVLQNKGNQNDAEWWLLDKGLATSAPECVLQQVLSTSGPSESVLLLALVNYLAEKHLLKCTRRKWKQRTIWHNCQMIWLCKHFICNKNKHLFCLTGHKILK